MRRGGRSSWLGFRRTQCLSEPFFFFFFCRICCCSAPGRTAGCAGATREGVPHDEGSARQRPFQRDWPDTAVAGWGMLVRTRPACCFLLAASSFLFLSSFLCRPPVDHFQQVRREASTGRSTRPHGGDRQPRIQSTFEHLFFINPIHDAILLSNIVYSVPIPALAAARCRWPSHSAPAHRQRPPTVSLPRRSAQVRDSSSTNPRQTR